jgi:hypothetical protein
MYSSHLLIALKVLTLSVVVRDEIFSFYVYFNGLKGGRGMRGGDRVLWWE